LTVRQISLPNPLQNNADATPVLRTSELSMHDKVNLSDNFHLEYGLTAESVALLQKVTAFSPFARATYDLGRNGSVRFAYANGMQPMEFAARAAGPESNDALNQDLAALALLPRISRRDGELQLQRSETFELGYEIADGSRVFSVGVYKESVT